MGNFVQETEYDEPNGGTGIGKFLNSGEPHEHEARLRTSMALLTADNVQVVLRQATGALLNFPKANWSPRFGVAYQIDNKTVMRWERRIFMGGFEPGGGSALTQDPPYVHDREPGRACPAAQREPTAHRKMPSTTPSRAVSDGFQASGGIEHLPPSRTIQQAGTGDPSDANAVHHELQPERAARFLARDDGNGELRGQRGTPPGHALNNAGTALAITIGGQRPATALRRSRISLGSRGWPGRAKARTTRCRLRCRRNTATGLSLLGTVYLGACVR